MISIESFPSLFPFYGFAYPIKKVAGFRYRTEINQMILCKDLEGLKY